MHISVACDSVSSCSSLSTALSLAGRKQFESHESAAESKNYSCSRRKAQGGAEEMPLQISAKQFQMPRIESIQPGGRQALPFAPSSRPRKLKLQQKLQQKLKLNQNWTDPNGLGTEASGESMPMRFVYKSRRKCHSHRRSRSSTAITWLRGTEQNGLRTGDMVQGEEFLCCSPLLHFWDQKVLKNLTLQ